MLEAFHFIRPGWLLLLIPSVFLAVLISREQDHHRSWRGVIADHLLPYLVNDDRGRRGWRPIHALAVFWTLAVIALAGPSWRQEPAPFSEDEAGLVIVMKVTPSMLAQDVQPSRLTRAAHKITDLLDERPATSTALVAYAGSAHLVMPMTRDARIIELFAAELSPDIMPKQGDDLASALELANEQLRKSGKPGSILLIADSLATSVTEASLQPSEGQLAPIHILAVAGDDAAELPPGSPPASEALDRDELKSSAQQLNASLTFVSADDRDVQRLSRQLESSLVAANQQDGGQRWQDAGYWLTPLLLFLALAWFRPGWVVSLE